MELIGLDAKFQTVRVLSCINIQWNRKYYEAGQFAIQLYISNWSASIAYIHTVERPEVGMVQKVETEHSLKGDFVNVSGFFLEGMLNWKVTYPYQSRNGNLSAACKAMVASLMADTGVTVPANADLGASVVLESKGEYLGDALYAALEAQELSQRIWLDYDNAVLHYGIWQGLNRTQSQSVNPYAVFSQNFGTVDSLTLTRDYSAYRNGAVVLYEGGAVTLDLRADASEPKRLLFIDTSLSADEGQSPESFLLMVQAEGRKQLLEYPKLISIDATVLQNNYLYLQDYDLGDKCDVQDDRLRQAFESRIIEVQEVWKENTHSVTLVFGDKLPVKYR